MCWRGSGSGLLDRGAGVWVWVWGAIDACTSTEGEGVVGGSFGDTRRFWVRAGMVSLARGFGRSTGYIMIPFELSRQGLFYYYNKHASLRVCVCVVVVRGVLSPR